MRFSALDAADFAERNGPPILPGISGQAAQHAGSGSVAGADRDGQPQRVVPVLRQVGSVDGAADQTTQRLWNVLAPEGVEPAVFQTTQARREPVAQEGK